MENRGYEEEQHQREQRTTENRAGHPRESPLDDALPEPSSPDGHVYEDVSPKPRDCFDPPSETLRDPRNEEIETGFRRNLTLPFRRGNGLDLAGPGSSVRVTSREKHPPEEVSREPSETSRDFRPARRRRKKDCKHCRGRPNAASPPEDSRDLAIEASERETVVLDARNFDPNFGPGCRADVHATAGNGNADTSTTVFSISEKIVGPPTRSIEVREYERTAFPASLVHAPDVLEDKVLIVPEKSRPAGMRVNSIYSQERWYAKDPPIFFTDIKDRAAFQRAYSLPGRTETPSSQNRVNLRRSVRGEPPPHPAKLRKHRHGWTLHLARPLEGSGCTRSLVLLLIVVLALLGVGAVALYVVFEPEKLQIIQQYLRSSAGNASSSGSSSRDVRFPPATDVSPRNETSTARPPPFPESPGPPATTESETEAPPATASSTDNSTRYCDDCLREEVCVALVDEEVPVCRIGLDPRDPTGCAGHCLINEQRCHRLDVDAFRCVQVEHYCLEDEWTCANTLCIPLDKRCDGHMNCYDHSDEYNCVCDPETHFQCGNETSCLPLEKRCDGKIDCWDAADEINCTLACPMENEFTCSNGQCIAKARFCDGLSDCADGSDEPHGCQGRCNKHEFTCQNSRCITKGMKCNGIDDCGDGTDERHCKDRRF